MGSVGRHLLRLVAGAVRGGSGAIYLFCRLPEGCEDDVAIVRWLALKHGVCLIPGSGCGLPGHVRVCYANLSLEKTKEAAARLADIDAAYESAQAAKARSIDEAFAASQASAAAPKKKKKKKARAAAEPAAPPPTKKRNNGAAPVKEKRKKSKKKAR